MNNNMNSNNSGDITQKDLLKLLFDQAQHNATREEMNALEARMDKRFEKIDERFEKVDAKFDRLNWLLITTLVGVIASLILQILK
jgi:hypothetical protein